MRKTVLRRLVCVELVVGLVAFLIALLFGTLEIIQACNNQCVTDPICADCYRCTIVQRSCVREGTPGGAPITHSGCRGN